MKSSVLITLFSATLFSACSKDDSVKPASGVNLKFSGDPYYLSFMRIDAHWIRLQHKAMITAYGYGNEVFHLYLEQVSDTGIMAHPTIRNISFTDGLYFNPDTLTDGYIKVDHLDSNTINGEFKVGLAGFSNSTPYRAIEGGFGIVTP